MVKYACSNCGIQVQTDGAPGTQEDCPACAQANTIPQPTLTAAEAEAREEAARAAVKRAEAEDRAEERAEERAEMEKALRSRPRYKGLAIVGALLKSLGGLFVFVGFVCAMVALGPRGERAAPVFFVGVGIAFSGLFYIGMGLLLLCVRDMAIFNFYLAATVVQRSEAPSKLPDETPGA